MRASKFKSRLLSSKFPAGLAWKLLHKSISIIKILTRICLMPPFSQIFNASTGMFETLYQKPSFIFAETGEFS